MNIPLRLTHLVHQIRVGVEFDQSLLEEFDLHIEIHAGRTAEADQAAMDRDIGILPFVPGLSLGPRKSTEFLVTKVQSPSRMIGVNSQSFTRRALAKRYGWFRRGLCRLRSSQALG
ncbi:hypothetical protein [Brucella sp. NBRC 12953]|uniref:hypothetical protein n=1 Tax=Brucella sp. NBRC 12953 TaxID=3075481 RepID=UPI00333F6E87